MTAAAAATSSQTAAERLYRRRVSGAAVADIAPTSRPPIALPQALAGASIEAPGGTSA